MMVCCRLLTPLPPVEDRIMQRLPLIDDGDDDK